MRGGQGGFSLMEVVVAATLASMILLGIGSIFATAERNVSEHGDYRRALAIAQAEIEAIQKLPPGDPKLRMTTPGRVEVVGGSVLDDRQAAGHVTILEKSYGWDATCSGLATLPGTPCTGLYRRLEWVDDPNFDLDGKTIEGRAADYKKVTIVLAWPDPLSDPTAPRMNRVDLSTYVAK